MASGDLDQQPLDPRNGKRWLPLVLIIAAFITLTQYSKIPFVEPVNCGAGLGANAAEVVMLSASWCRYCRQARRFFVSEHVNYCEYDIEQTPEGEELYARSRFGAIPVIFVRGETLIGFDRDEITRVLIVNGLFVPTDS